MQTDCVILGGGAGGLCAAAALGRRGLRVTVVERLPRVGKKLLATGNGRCNLSNLDMQRITARPRRSSSRSMPPYRRRRSPPSSPRSA